MEFFDVRDSIPVSECLQAWGQLTVDKPLLFVLLTELS